MEIKFKPTGTGVCAKQEVKATLIALNGIRYYGSNYCLTPQQICPRGDLPSGVGYEMCKGVCNQPAHAEVNAIYAAGRDKVGSTIYVEGHTFACESCKQAARDAGVVEIIIGEPPDGDTTQD